MNKTVRYGILLASVVFVVLGITRGEPQEVLQKAIHICLECIGVG